jgi:uncharacterized protein (DUF302 family)
MNHAFFQFSLFPVCFKKGGAIMSYYFSAVLSSSFDDAVRDVTEALKAEGFGIAAEVTVKLKAVIEKVKEKEVVR